MAYPQSVIINEAHLTRLVGTYEDAYKQIYAEIANSTEFGAARRRIILSHIEAELRALGVDTTKYLEKELPELYKAGADDAVSQLKTIYAPVAIKTGFNKLHREAIAALVSDTAAAFGESMGMVNGQVKSLMSLATKESITQRLATGQIQGSALRRVQQQIIGVLEQDGLRALVDKAGHSWTLNRYSEMLIRTKSVEARNLGLVNRLVENGYDLVQVSKHGATDVCKKSEGKVYSLTGATPGYPKLDTVTHKIGSKKPGLFHPNCKHAINALTLELARETMAWNSKTRQYEKGLI